MSFVFQFELDLGRGRTPYFVSEPGNEIVLYSEEIGMQKNEISHVSNGKYNLLYFDEQSPRLTKTKISGYGIKSSSGVGSYGFYVDEKAENTYIKVPVKYTIDSELPGPSFWVYDRETVLEYTIRGPGYDCFRVVLNQGLLTYEFVVYSDEGEIEKPYGMYGNFDVYVVGYKNEIQEQSGIAWTSYLNVNRRPDDSDRFVIEKDMLLPEGGDEGQIIIKSDEENYKVNWEDVEGDAVEGSQKPISSGAVYDILGDIASILESI